MEGWVDLEFEEGVGEGRQDVGFHSLLGQQDLLGTQVLGGEVGDDQGPHCHVPCHHLLSC